MWQDAAEAAPDHVLAIDEAGREYSIEEIDAAAEGLAAALQNKLGLAAGERIALVMPNCIEFVAAYLGILKAGCVAVPVNIRLAPDEIKFILNDAGASAIFIHESTHQLVETVLPETPNVRAKISVGFSAEGYEKLDELVLDKSNPKSKIQNPKSTDTAAIIYTSGTTGRPKGAEITQGNIYFNAVSARLGLSFGDNDRHILAVPLFHVTGLNTILPSAILERATVIITASPSPLEQLKLVERHRATTLLGVPTTFIMMAALKDIDKMDLSSLRLIGYSGAPMPADAIRRLREMFPHAALHNFYGLTETTSIASVLPAKNALTHAESIGKPVERVEFMIADDAGRALPAGETGELCIRGGNVFKGYLNKPDATAEAFFPEKWFRTGDNAAIDSDGFVYLKGRKKEMIIVAGENVYPIEVENVICEHPAVREAAILGMPGGAFGELVRAVVVLKDGASATAQDIRRHCAGKLASYKVPHKVDFVEKLPRNPSGKIVKRLL